MISHRREKEQLLAALRMGLGIGENAESVFEVDVPASGHRARLGIDIELKQGNRRFFIDVKQRADMNAVARMVLFRYLLEKKGGRLQKDTFVLAAHLIPLQVEEMAREAGIRVLELPSGVSVRDDGAGSGSKPKGKVTSDKSWKIMARLLKSGSSSIRNLALQERVSYGWAHATVQALKERGIVRQQGNRVTLDDMDRLLNGVAWERPFEKLYAGSVYLHANNPLEAAADISRMLTRREAAFAFTGYTAGEIYTGYGRRHDRVYLYLGKEDAERFISDIGWSGKTGIEVRVYVPDREMFEGVVEKGGLVLVPPRYALLDLAGMGYAGRDMARDMVKKYDSL